MAEYDSTNKRSIMPKNVVSTLKKSWKGYRFGRQEDAHEFFVMFLQGILRASFGSSPKLTKKYEQLSMIYRVFAGKLRSQVKCLSCSHCSDSFEPFLALSLDVSKGKTFEECIRHFCEPELLEGDNKYQCGKCQKLSRAKKRMTIYKPPRILTIHFLRFTMTGRKIGKHIKFPKCFNLRVFVSENTDTKLPKEQQTDHIYSLQGVIIHAGKGSKSGHYYSFIKRDNKWYLCDDERISEVKDINQVMKQNAYMLIYQYKMPLQKKQPKKKETKVKDQTDSPLLGRTKSLTKEIINLHEGKSPNTIPLSGYFETKEEVNSEEEEEKLVEHDPLNKEQQKKFSELEYIMDNFEDVDLDTIKNLDVMKNLSVVSLRDDIRIPELKNYISNTLEMHKKKVSAVKQIEDEVESAPTQTETIKSPQKKLKRKRKPSEVFKAEEPAAAPLTPSKKRDKKNKSKNRKKNGKKGNMVQTQLSTQKSE